MLWTIHTADGGNTIFKWLYYVYVNVGTWLLQHTIYIMAGHIITNGPKAQYPDCSPSNYYTWGCALPFCSFRSTRNESTYVKF